MQQFPIEPNVSRSRLNCLIKSLSSVLNYFDLLFTKPLEFDMDKNKKEIEKELREFIGIYKWQEANYWSLKQSIQKSNRVLLRTIRKFRSYLKEPINFEHLVKANSVSPSNHKFLEKFYKINDLNQQSEDTYFKKMDKFVRKLLSSKFAKNRLNQSIEKLNEKIRERNLSLNREIKSLSTKYASAGNDKETVVKLKKEFKYLNQEKLMFVSDLLKELSAIGNICL